MLGCVYMFEREGTPGDIQHAISVIATRAIEAGINERPGIRYQELTEPTNPKPVFSVLFNDPSEKPPFDSLFERALKLCGLRVTTLRVPTESSPASEHRAELGYVDREQGYVLVIPSVRRPAPE